MLQVLETKLEIPSWQTRTYCVDKSTMVPTHMAHLALTGFTFSCEISQITIDVLSQTIFERIVLSGT